MNMSVALITGSGGLIGAEASRQFAAKGLTVVGIDNDMRRRFFGDYASTRWASSHLESTLHGYRHVDADIRDEDAMRQVFATYKRDIAVVIHTAAQPSHDWAARDPVTDFTVNANGTLNLLLMTRQYCPDAPFIFCSTNCLTGPGHSGAVLHGFLSYLMKCAVSGEHYRVLGYKGKQVRDNIHSFDLVNAFWCVFQRPQRAEVYNIGGARHANCSILEAIKLCEGLTGRPMNWSYVEENRLGDHIWWIGDVRRFQSHYPEWDFTYDIRTMLAEIYDAMRQRTHSAATVS
jgi:nucleoside-diphosphate-sugar epimerase